jgi:hypothetical protein
MLGAIVRSAQLASQSRSRPLDKEMPMTVTVLYPEDRQIPDLTLEQEIFGPETRLIRAAKPSFAELDPADCAAADGLMIMRWLVTAGDLDRFPRLRCVVRMGGRLR